MNPFSLTDRACPENPCSPHTSRQNHHVHGYFQREFIFNKKCPRLIYHEIYTRFQPTVIKSNIFDLLFSTQSCMTAEKTLILPQHKFLSQYIYEYIEL